MYFAEANHYPAYALNISDIHLRSETTLPAPQLPLITEIPDSSPEEPIAPVDPIEHMSITDTVSKEPVLQSQDKPPFPQRLQSTASKSLEEPTFDILDQLKNVQIQIPLFQAIKDVPIYGKFIKEAYLKKPGRKKKDPQTIHVLEKLANIMLGNVVIPKYTDPGSLVVQIHINGQIIKNILIDLGVAINVMTKHTMDILNILNIRSTPTVLQLADSSTITPDGMVEDVIVSLESW